MNKYSSHKNDLLSINSSILSLLEKAEAISGLSDHSYAQWKKTCQSIDKQVQEDVIRIAVVGAIKSGKSTFVNSLFKGDYLKRGAGVVTSIVTRIRGGDRRRAKLFFKTWDDVNLDINQALVMFPALQSDAENSNFDIRRKKDRDDLMSALDSMGADELITDGTLDVNSVLLLSYLNGFDHVESFILPENTTKEYKGDHIEEHKAFTGNDSRAVYLKDIQLEIKTDDIDKDIEIADCQGSDSPNPLHLAMIQDYLRITNLIIYVISSRTGLRRADIRFLSMIKEMGIMDNIIFVLNCDFSEHEAKEDLESIISKVKQEVAFLKPDADIYTFSSLYNLFKEEKKNLSKKDLGRLKQWDKEEELSGFSDHEAERFIDNLRQKLTGERLSLLLRNHLERLWIIASGMQYLTGASLDILAGDSDTAGEIIKGIEINRKKMDQIKSMIRSTLDGMVQKSGKGLKADIENFFDARSGGILPEIIKFIRSQDVQVEEYREHLASSGFRNTMYMIYQGFKRTTDAFMAESINPKVISFVRKEEEKIYNELEGIAGPYDVMIQDALVDYSQTMDNFGIEMDSGKNGGIKLPDAEAIRGIAGIELPQAAAAMRYNTKIKTEAVMHLGMYKAVKLFKKMLKKPIEDNLSEEIAALKHGVKRMRAETERSVLFHFKNYKENIKFQYILKLLDAMSNSLYETLLGRFSAYIKDLSRTVELIDKKQVDIERVQAEMEEISTETREISRKIERLREEIEAGGK